MKFIVTIECNPRDLLSEQLTQQEIEETMRNLTNSLSMQVNNLHINIESTK